jgi:cell division protein FtsB
MTASSRTRVTRTPVTRRPAPSRRVLRRLWPLLGSIFVVGVLLVGVFPTRTYLAQRAAISRASEQLDVLQQQNATLEERADLLTSDAEIERLARERYNLVRPGEEAYAVLPPAGMTTTTTTPPPLAEEAKPEGNPLQRAWRAVTGLF